MTSHIFEVFNGPHGLTEVDLFEDIDDVIAIPLKAQISLSISARGAFNPTRIVTIKDALGQTLADAFLPREADKETQAQAAQWLLDLCCTRLGAEGTEFKHDSNPFNVIYRK